MTSAVWRHFSKDSLNNNAKCLYCGSTISISGGSTKGLWRHIETKHKRQYSESYDLKKRKKEESSSIDKDDVKKAKITSHFSITQKKNEDQNLWDERLVRIVIRNNNSMSYFDNADVQSLTRESGYKVEHKIYINYLYF